MFSLCCQSQESRFLRASRRGDTRTLQTLYESGIDVATTAGKKSQENALHKAVAYNRPEVIRVLLREAATPEKRAALVNARNSDGRSPLSCAAALGRDILLTELLNCKETNVNLPANDSRTPIELALDNHHFSTVRLLLKNPEQDTSSSVLSALWTTLIMNDYVLINHHASDKKEFRRDAIQCDVQQLKQLSALIKDLAAVSSPEMIRRGISLIEMGSTDIRLPLENYILQVLRNQVNTSGKFSIQCRNTQFQSAIKQLKAE